MEYADIINRIIEAERRAQAIVAEANESDSRISDDIKRDVAARREDYRAKVDRRLALVAERENALTGEREAEFEQNHAKKLRAIDAAFDENGEKWISELFARITEASV